MAIRPYKFIIIPVVQVLNDDGEVTGEQMPDAAHADTAFGVAGLLEYAQDFENNFAALQEGLTVPTPKAPKKKS